MYISQTYNCPLPMEGQYSIWKDVSYSKQTGILPFSSSVVLVLSFSVYICKMEQVIYPLPNLRGSYDSLMR